MQSFDANQFNLKIFPEMDGIISVNMNIRQQAT